MESSSLAPTLVVLAAGLGRRYGGLKQVEPVGPSGETILDYSVYDALRGGFGKIVFVIRADLQADFRTGIGARIEAHAAVAYAFQSRDLLPDGITAPPVRDKPWGTGQAVLAAGSVVREPFAVVNADDFYGPSGFADLAAFLRETPAGPTPTFAVIGYRLRDTLADSGGVSRAVCRCTPDGWLEGIEETTGIEREGTGARFADCAGQVRYLSGDELVSMNLWGFTPAVFALLDREFRRFLDRHGASLDAEFYLPAAVDTMNRAADARVRVLPSRDAWCGVTHREDQVRVAEWIRALVAQGVYPSNLWR